MIYLANSFSVSMLYHPDVNTISELRVERISGWTAGNILRTHDFVSVYGHEDSAKILRRYWQDVPVPVARRPISLRPDDMLIVASSQRDRDREDGYDWGHKPWFRFYRITLTGAKNENDRRRV